MWYRDLMSALDKLKHLKRTGWVHSGVPEPETVACHMYRMALLAMSLDGQIEECDMNRVLRMSLVHDLAEAYVGDITPKCGVSDEEKHALEQMAMSEICSELKVGDEWMSLWQDYETQNTKEAVVTKHLDKFDMVSQALEYEEKYPDLNLVQFFDSTKGFFVLEPFKSWDTDIRQRREKLWEERNSTGSH